MKRLLLIVAAMLIVGGLCFATGGGEKGTTTTAKAKAGGVLVFGRSGDAVGLDPARETDGESFYIADNVYETLVRFVPGSTALEPDLAEKWTVSADGLTYTFNLRKGVTFHDGTPFNADAVAQSLGRQFKKDSPYYDNGPWQYWSAMDMDNIVKDVVKVNDLTVKFTL